MEERGVFVDHSSIKPVGNPISALPLLEKVFSHTSTRLLVAAGGVRCVGQDNFACTAMCFVEEGLEALKQPAKLHALRAAYQILNNESTVLTYTV